MKAILKNITVWALTLWLTCFVASAAANELHTGDLIFQVSRSDQSQAISEATGSHYSHMGMVVLRNGQPWVLEAGAHVRYTPLSDWTASGVNGHYVVKRLAGGVPDAQAAARMVQAAQAYLGKPYDRTFAWSDTHMYCSELVWKLYQRTLGITIGALRPLKDFHLHTPEVRRKLQERYGAEIPWDEPMIAPSDMFDSPLLHMVVSVGQVQHIKMAP